MLGIISRIVEVHPIERVRLIIERVEVRPANERIVRPVSR